MHHSQCIGHPLRMNENQAGEFPFINTKGVFTLAEALEMGKSFSTKTCLHVGLDVGA
jgi:hypothetical protein